MGCPGLDSLIVFATSEKGAAFGSFLSGIAGSVAVLVAIGGGIIGFDAWKRELRGKSQHDTAAKVLLAVYRIRDAIAAARNPSYRIATEGVQYGLAAMEAETASVAQNVVDLYYERLTNVTDIRQELHLAEQEALARLGPDASKPLEPLYNVITQLITAADVYFAMEYSRVGAGESRASRPDLLELHRELFDTGPTDFNDRVVAAVKAAEDWYRPHLD